MKSNYVRLMMSAEMLSLKLDVVELDVDELCSFRCDVVDDLLLKVCLRDADEVVVDDEQDDPEV